MQAIVGIGSIASGLARPDSDIDAMIFLDPFDLYIIPAESKWYPSDGSFHSIFEQNDDGGKSLQLDMHRVDLSEWTSPSFEWPEERCAELSEGWIAYDRSGAVTRLIETRASYSENVRIPRLDEAIIWLDQHLEGDRPQSRWHSLGPLIADDRLQAAYVYLVQALFAINRRWRPWRNREMSYLLSLPWLPQGFGERVRGVVSSPSLEYAGYMSRADGLRSLFEDVLTHLADDDSYGKDAISQAFVRSAEEPGRAWNMDEWNRKHAERNG